MAIDTDNALTNLIEAKAWLAVKPAPDVTYDSEIEKLIDSVSWQFNSFTKRRLLARDITDLYSGENKPIIKMPEYPINSVTSIHVDADRDFTDDTLIDSTSYVFTKDGFIYMNENIFTSLINSNKIVYNAGYVTIPKDLLIACLDQVKFMFRRHINNQEGIATEASINGSVTVTEVGEILTTSMEVLKRYRREDHIK